MVAPQALQALFQRLRHEGRDIGAVRCSQPEFGADDHLGLQAGECTAEVALRFAIAVDRRGVEIVDAGVDGAPRRARLLGCRSLGEQPADRAGAADPNQPDTQITAAKAQEQINTVNTEDMLKYAPSLVVRKRHYGDTQDPVATRTSGVGASARNLIFVDGIMLNSPIGNNNSGASPNWSVVAPKDVSRIDVLYGPFSARYAGNSIGAFATFNPVISFITRENVIVGTSVNPVISYTC